MAVNLHLDGSLKPSKIVTGHRQNTCLESSLWDIMPSRLAQLMILSQPGDTEIIFLGGLIWDIMPSSVTQQLVLSQRGDIQRNKRSGT